MAKHSLKLYRGLSSAEFNMATDKVLARNRRSWALLLSERARGQMQYPSHLNEQILALKRDLRLETQYFTDSRAVAQSYARKVSGLLVEITVPVEQVLRHFEIEFQNFGNRKKKFEIVYRVRGALLKRKVNDWRLRIRRVK